MSLVSTRIRLDCPLVLCMHEKSQIQALDRTVPWLKMRFGQRAAAKITNVPARPVWLPPSMSPAPPIETIASPSSVARVPAASRYQGSPNARPP